MSFRILDGDVARQVCEAAHEARDGGAFAARVVSLLCRLGEADRAVLVELNELGVDRRERASVSVGDRAPRVATGGAVVTLRLAWRGRPIAHLHLERARASGPFPKRALDRVRAVVPIVELAWAALRAPVPNADRDGAGRLATLSPRQREIAELVARGLTTPEIAELLGSSPNTVRNQLSVLFRLTHTSTRAELAGLVARAVHLSY